MKGVKGFQPGPDHWNWSGDNLSYYTKHDRCAKARGQASIHECFMICGKMARDWAQIHETDGIDPICYIPLCRGCHIVYDKNDYTDKARSDALKGVPWSPTRRAAHRPWHQSEEAKAKISAARKANRVK
jgi:hypothetical protein